MNGTSTTTHSSTSLALCAAQAAALLATAEHLHLPTPNVVTLGYGRRIAIQFTGDDNVHAHRSWVDWLDKDTSEDISRLFQDRVHHVMRGSILGIAVELVAVQTFPTAAVA